MFISLHDTASHETDNRVAWLYAVILFHTSGWKKIHARLGEAEGAGYVENRFFIADAIRHLRVCIGDRG